ncbi:MAG: hypothetical protein WBP47_04670 [Candidatus Promineifilaceae bacterium]
MRAIIEGMNDASSSQPLTSDETAVSPTAVQAWLLQEQQRLADIVGEPLFVTIRLIYDGSVEVEVETFTDRHGMAAGDSLPETWQAAVETLLVLDEICAIS